VDDDATLQKDAAEQQQQQPGPSMRFLMTQYYSEWQPTGAVLATAAFTAKCCHVHINDVGADSSGITEHGRCYMCYVCAL
jgi:hypothetical protein